MAYTAAAVIAEAKKHVGYRETGRNDTIFNRAFGSIPGYPHDGYGYPWCQSYQSYIHGKAGGRKNVDYPHTVSCLTATGWFKKQGRFHKTPQVGDMLMCGPNGSTHVELVIAVEPGRVQTIGGNTGGSLNGAYYNGDGVYIKWWDRSNPKIHGYGRPKYSA